MIPLCLRFKRRLAVLLTAALFLGMLLGAVYPPERVRAADAVTRYPIADATVQGGNSKNTNFGTNTKLAVKGSQDPNGSRKAYLKFDLSGLGEISSAKLRLYGKNNTSGSTVILQVYGAAEDSWTESGITWSNAPGKTGEALASGAASSTLQYNEFDVTSFVQNEQTEDGTASFLLEDSGETEAFVDFYSKEHTANKPPELVLQQADPNPGQTSGPSGSPGPTPTPTGQPPGEIIIDNSGSFFTTDSPWTSSVATQGFEGSDYLTDGTAGADSPDRWAKWTPDIPVEGYYGLYMKWTAGSNRPGHAPLEIGYKGGTDTEKTVNQKLNNGMWVFIGSYLLEAGGTSYVKLLATDAGYTIADAIKLVYFGATPPASTPSPSPSASPAPNVPQEPTTDAVKVMEFGIGNTGGVRVAEFDAVPSVAHIDTAIGLTGSAAEPAAREDFPVAVRLNGEGYFDALNDNAFESLESVAYSVYGVHHVKIAVNLHEGTYDAWVTPPGGSPVRFARDYRVAGGALPLDDIGKLYMQTNANGISEIRNARLIGNSFSGAATFTEGIHRLESDNTGSKVLRYDVKPVTGAGNEIMGFADHGASIAAFSNLAMIVRMAGERFDAYDLNGYKSNNELKAELGITYHVKLVPDFAAKTYSVWVAPEGGDPVRIADSYRFRSSSANTTNLGSFLAKTDDSADYRVNNVIVLDQTQLSAALDAVNQAATAAQMRKALASGSLGLSMDKFYAMPEEEKNKLAQDLLAGIPYADDLSLQRAFDNPMLVQHDLEPPSPPTGLHADTTASLQVKLAWMPAMDDVGITHYKVFRDGEEIAAVSSGTLYVDSKLQPDTVYSYTVKAYDMGQHESVSQPLQVRTVPPEQAKPFPLTQPVLEDAFRQPLLRYTMYSSGTVNPAANPPANYKTVAEYDTIKLNSAFALYYLVAAAANAPDYMVANGEFVYARALAQIRSVIAGGNEPGFSGNGLSGFGYLPILQAVTLAKRQAPALWSQLTEAEKEKIGLMVEAALIGAHWGYSDNNSFSTGLDQAGNFGKDWNPNYRNGGIGPVIAAVYYFGEEECNSKLKNFDYDAFMARLAAAGFTNTATVFSNTGKYLLEAHTRNDGPDGFTYKGHTLNEIGLWYKEVVEYTFDLPVSPVGGFQVPVSPTYPYGYQGFLINGYDEFPNLGAIGMGHEFNASDANGGRSSISYVYASWQSVITNFNALQLFGSGAAGLTAEDMAALGTLTGIGTTDMLYKDANLYNDYSKGVNRGAQSLSNEFGIGVSFNKDLWIHVIDNPAQSLAAFNGAMTAGEMREQVEKGGLNLVRYGYDALTQAGKDAVLQMLLAGRPMEGYRNKAEVQEALYQAVKAESIRALNEAATPEQMLAALKSNALGLYIPAFDSMHEAYRPAAAQKLLDMRPAEGYAGKSSIRNAVNAAVEAVNLDPPAGQQFKNLPPVAGNAQRINIAEYDAWPQNPGDAHVALWNDDKVGAYSITIDDNFNNEHNQWLDFSRKYGFDFTWFVITGSQVTGSMQYIPAEWERMIAAGQDVQSHTVSHEDRRETANFTEQQYIDDYLGAVEAINALAGGNAKTLGYPFGGGNKEIAARYYIAARGVQGYPNQAGSVDYMSVASFSNSGATKIEATGPNDSSVEAIVKTLIDPEVKVLNQSYYRGWSNSHWHSINASAFNSSKGMNLKGSDVAGYMLDYLDEYRDQIWVGTFTEVAMYGQERDTHKLRITEKTRERITFTITDQMDDTLFDFPLTVKVRVHNDWSSISARQNGAEVPVSVVMHGGNRYALVKAVPDKGAVELVPGNAEELALGMVNSAATAGEMKEALASPVLGLELSGYAALSESSREGAARRLLMGRPAEGYADKAALQAALDSAAASEAVAPAEGYSLSGPAGVTAGEAVNLTFSLINVTSAVYGQWLTVNYDPAYLQYVSAEPLGAGYTVADSVYGAGQMRIEAKASSGGGLKNEAGKGTEAVSNESAAGSGSVDVTGPADVLRLRFLAVPAPRTAQSSVYLTDVVVASESGSLYTLNDGPVYRVEIRRPSTAELDAVLAEARTAAEAAQISESLPGHYPQSAVEALNAAIAAALASAEQAATQEEADQAAQRLADALAAFRAAAHEAEEPQEPGDPQESEDPDNNPGVQGKQAEPQSEEQDHAAVAGNTISITPKTDSNGKALIVVRQEDMDIAVQQAAGRMVVIDVKSLQDIREVKVQLPVGAILSADVDSIRINTGLGSVLIPAGLLKESGAGEKSRLQAGLAKAEQAALPPGVRQQLGTGSTILDFSLSVDQTPVHALHGRTVPVELPYTLQPGELPHKVVVYGISGDGSLSIIRHGAFNTASGKVEFSASHFGLYAAVYREVGFSDLTHAVWAKTAIEGLAARDVVHGTGNGRFEPDGRVTRAEFITMLVNAFDLVNLQTRTAFADVGDGMWYDQAVASAYELGIVDGLPDGSFGADEPVTRQDMTVILYRVADLLVIPLQQEEVHSSIWKDQAFISDYALEAVEALRQTGIIQGFEDGAFAPKANASRAQAAVMLARLMQASQR